MNSPSLLSYLAPLPLVAVLRGISPAEIPEIGAVLADSGFRMLEVPMNSPEPLESITLLAKSFGERCLTGAGTVVKVSDVARVAQAGGRLVVMPHADVAIIREAKRLGLTCVPGVSTLTEAFAALDAGADGLKMFPAELLAPAVLKAWRAVLPGDVVVFAVGGIRPDNMAPYWEAGADGFGTGSNLYKPGASADDVRRAAAAYASGFAMLKPR
jgi:2-dehydro-3-deoxyphosphogalactonate aldolase